MLKNLPLKRAIVLPFATLLLITLVLIGGLAMYTGEKSVSEVTISLAEEAGQHIVDKTADYLHIPIEVNELNSYRLLADTTLLTDQRARDVFFVDRLKTYPTILYSFIGTPKGDFHGACRWEDNKIRLVQRDSSHTDGNSHYFLLNDDSSRGSLDRVFKNFDPRLRPWYTAGLATKEPTWSGVYRHFVINDLAVSASKALYKPSGDLIGVLGVDYTLKYIRDYLQSLKIGKSGIAYIIDQEHNLVSSSTTDSLYSLEKGVFKRIAARDAKNALIASTTDFFERNLGKLSYGQHSFSIRDKHNFIYSASLFEKTKLPWQIVVVIPQNDYLSGIIQNTKITFIIGIIAFILALFGGLWLAKSITDPLSALNNASKKVAKGNFDAAFTLQRRDEVGELSHSFFSMAHQLKTAFSDLEHKVEKRTEDLSRKNMQLQEEIFIREKIQNELKLSQEHLLTANITKDKLFSIIAHDLRGPISSILSILDLVNSGMVKEADTKKLMYDVERNTQSTYGLLENLLLWAKSQQSQIEYNPQRLEVGELVTRTFGILEGIARQKDITFEVAAVHSVWSDPNMVLTVLRNLVSNACKFTHRGGKISVTSRKDDDTVTITVEDNGLGMPQEIIDKLFKLEEHVSTHGTEKEPGSGFGLILCREFVEKCGGKIWVESEPGRGSKFNFTLPGA